MERTKREWAEGVIEALGDWMLKLMEVMKGEFLSASFCLVVMCLDGCFFFAVVVSGRREAEAIQAEMSHLEDPSVQAKNPFWAYGDKARTFALLRERADQVPRAIGLCERVLQVVYGELFPLNEAPRKLEDLFTRFIHPEDVRHMVRQ